MDFVNGINRDQLVMMVYNIRRLMSIFNINDLKARLQSLVFQIMGIYGLYKAQLSTFYFLNAQQRIRFFTKCSL